MIELEINYSKTSEKFVLKNKSIISFKKIRELLEKGIRKLNNQNVNIDVKELKGKLQGLYRIRKGNIRIIFEYYKGQIHIVNIETIDFRGDVY
ncbi:MAG: hypothetical protein GX121_01625 [Ignavibacteria bacterium]|jgi:mRNA-degrading endonuclease RelE of RelBE toxin-antitoxin system|nr:hypothetical protein [Ignavibacteria bacterium]